MKIVIKPDDEWLDWLHGGHWRVKHGVAMHPSFPLEEIDPWIEENKLVDMLDTSGFWNEGVKKALELAKKVHGEQKRDDGAPYLEQHVYPVTASLLWIKRLDGLKGINIKKWMIPAALLHDVLEDGDIDENEVKDKFGENVYNAVKTLTKGRSWEEKWDIEAYKKNIMNAPKEVRIIKLADRTNNLLCLKYATENKRRRYLDETREFYLPLARETSNYFYTWIRDILMQIDVSQSA